MIRKTALAQMFESTVAFEGALVQGGAVDDHFLFHLLGDALEPLSLRPGPLMRTEDSLQRSVDSLIIGHERTAQSLLPDKTYDAGSDLLIGGFLIGGAQVGVGVALLSQGLL